MNDYDRHKIERDFRDRPDPFYPTYNGTIGVSNDFLWWGDATAPEIIRKLLEALEEAEARIAQLERET